MDSQNPPLESIVEEPEEGVADNRDSAVQVIGKGYNLMTKESASEDIFEYETRRTDFGIVVPAPAKSSAYSYAETEESSSPTKYSYRFEQRVCAVSMGNFEDLAITRDFRSDVEALPDKFCASDEGKRRPFEKFFERWGHCVVRKAFGGGSIVVKIVSDGKRDISGFTLKTFDALLGEGGAGVVSASTKWLGGEGRFQNADQMSEWKESLGEGPQLLTTEMSHRQISCVVGMVDPEKENACHKALKMFLDQRPNIAAAVQHDPWSSPLEVTELLEEAKRTLARTAECRVQRCKFKFEPVHPRRSCEETKKGGKCLIM